jgi:hypothetical protein
VSDEALREIRVVRLDRNVLKVPSIYTGPREFGDYASRNGVLIDRIAFEESETALRQAEKLKPSDSEAGTEPIMQLGVLVFGFAATNPPINSRFVPIVQIAYQMVDPAGNVIWKSSDRVIQAGNPVAPASAEAMLGNPKVIEDAWRRASREIAGRIVQKFGRTGRGALWRPDR